MAPRPRWSTPPVAARRAARAAAALSAVALVIGCTSTDHEPKAERSTGLPPVTAPDLTAPSPTARPATPAPTTTVMVSGRAVDAVSGGPRAGVVVGFRLSTCTTCGLHTATTGADGSYRLVVAQGTYDAACVATGATCVIDGDRP